MPKFRKKLGLLLHTRGESPGEEFSSTPEDAPSVVDGVIYLAARLCEVFFRWKGPKVLSPPGVGPVFPEKPSYQLRT